MQHRLAPLAIFVCLVAANTIVHGAGHGAENRCHLGWQRNNAWPTPFSLIDRKATCNPFVAMATKGWQRHSTITNYHFDQVTQQLTESGQLKVHEILETNPLEHRVVVMVRGRNDQETASRRISINEVAMRGIRKGQPPHIMEVDVEPRAWPAVEIEAIGKQYEVTIPEPRLPVMQSTISGDL